MMEGAADICTCRCRLCYFPSMLCSVVVWNLESGEALCGSPQAMQSAGPAYCLAFAHKRDDLFVTGGK
jgi:hypothetical protein